MSGRQVYEYELYDSGYLCAYSNITTVPKIWKNSRAIGSRDGLHFKQYSERDKMQPEDSQLRQFILLFSEPHVKR